MHTRTSLWTNLSATYCGVSEAATSLGISRQRVVALCQRGQLPGARLAFGRWWIPRAAIVERKKAVEERRRRKSKA